MAWPLAMREGVVEVAGPEHGQDGAEDLLLGDAGLGGDVGEDQRADEVAPLGQGADGRRRA